MGNRTLALALLLLVVTSTSFAQKPSFNYSTTELVGFAATWERSIANGHTILADDAIELGYFEGFVIGVFFSHQWPCVDLKKGVPTEQLWAVVAKYLRENPERRGLRPEALVLEALERVWGCNAK